MKDAGKEFPAVRIIGSIGWIAAGLFIGFMAIESATLTFQMAATYRQYDKFIEFSNFINFHKIVATMNL